MNKMDKKYALQETREYVLRYRDSQKIQDEDLISDFLDYVEEAEIDLYATNKEEKEHKEMVKKFRAYLKNYLGIDLEKVKLGESLMLERWKESVK